MCSESNYSDFIIYIYLCTLHFLFECILLLALEHQNQ